MAVIKFKRLDRHGFWLVVDASATESSLIRDTDLGKLDGYLDEIQRWTSETGVGVRMSYDMWRFNNAKDMTAFLLRWD